MNKIKLTALQHNVKIDKYMQALDLCDDIGVKVVISLKTDKEVTPEYEAMIAKQIQSMPPVDGIFFTDVKALPFWMEA